MNCSRLPTMGGALTEIAAHMPWLRPAERGWRMQCDDAHTDQRTCNAARVASLSVREPHWVRS